MFLELCYLYIPKAYIAIKAGTATMLSTARTVENFPLLPSSSSKLLCERLVRVGSLSSLCRRRKFSGSCYCQMPQNLKMCEMSFQDMAGTVLPAMDDQVEKAAQAIKAGHVIAVPTDTLYGFACDACSAKAVRQIYEIKGRKLTSPLAICVADVSDISRFAIVDHLPHGLLDALLPGAVTVVLRRGDCSGLEKSLNPGLDSIGVRVPDLNFIRAIAQQSESALALTSANLSGQTSSIAIKDFENLCHHCAYVFDGGVLPSGRAGSTIVDLVKPGLYKIIRPGSAREQTAATLKNFCLEEIP